MNRYPNGDACFQSNQAPILWTCFFILIISVLSSQGVIASFKNNNVNNATIIRNNDTNNSNRNDANNSKNKGRNNKISGGDVHVKKGGLLVYEAYEPGTINPLTYRDAGSIEILNNWVFESLLDEDIVTNEDIPWLAESWKISNNGREYFFTLNENAKWFDGQPVTPEDVVFSFEVFGREGVMNPFKKTQIQQIESITILPPRTIKFVAKVKDFSVFSFVSSNIILPKHLYDKANPKEIMSHKWIQFPLGSGPYKVSDWKKGDRAVLEKNPKYWGASLPQNQGAYNFDKIILRYIRDPQVAFESLKKKELDYMPIRVGNVELWRQTKTDKSFLNKEIIPLEVRSQLQEGYAFLGLNLKNDLFQSLKVRKALSMAINKQEIIDKSLDGSAVIPRGPLFSDANFKGQYQPLVYNPNEAKKLLAEEGWKIKEGDRVLEKNGRKFEFSVLVPNPRIEKEMLFIQSDLKKMGVQLNIKRVEYTTWQMLQDDRKFDAISNGRIRTLKANKVDPFGEWHSTQDSKGLRNYYGYKNKQVDELIEKAKTELSAERRIQLLTKINDQIASDEVLIQYSETKHLFHAVQSSIKLPEYQGKNWYPYSLGIKYWSRK